MVLRDEILNRDPADLEWGRPRIVERKNWNRSRTFNLVRQHRTTRKTRNHYLFKTEPKPTLASLAEWRRRAALCLADELQNVGLNTSGPYRQPTPITVENGVTLYMTWIEGDENHPRQNAEKTCDMRRAALTRFAGYLRDQWPDVKRVCHVTDQHVTGTGMNRQPAGYAPWRQLQGAATTTVRLEISIIQGWLDFAWRHQWRGRHEKLLMPPAPPKLPPTIPTDATIRQALAEGTPWMQALLTTAALTGGRRGELQLAKIDDWDGVHAVLHFRAKPGEVRTKLHARRIPVGPRLQRMLNEYVHLSSAEGSVLLFGTRGGPFTTQANIWLTYYDLTPHDLRRWFINSLTAAGCPQPWIDVLAGHAQDRTDSRYVNPDIEGLRKWIIGLEDRLLNPPPTTTGSSLPEASVLPTPGGTRTSQSDSPAAEIRLVPSET